MSPSLSLSTGDPALEAVLAENLRAVEDLLRRSLASDFPYVAETSRHLVDAGGKRFRPLLTLLAAQFGDPSAPGVVPAAAVMELTHLATLYHDDVMDEAPLRRGASSANHRYGNTVAILTGDFLFARASNLLADLGPEVVRLQARTFERLVVGQIRETVGPAPSDDPVAHYLSVVADKTGSLIATSGQLGAMMSGADPAVVEVLRSFGERIGVAFQLSDDLLDVTSEAPASGKVPGTDLREGVASLPILHARGRAAARGEELAGSDAERLVELLDADLNDDALHAEALALLRVSPAIEDTRRDLARWAEDARAALAPLPDGPSKAALELLCDAVTSRAS
jgi:heptaprenyl diphosphate synthase